MKRSMNIQIAETYLNIMYGSGFCPERNLIFFVVVYFPPPDLILVLMLTHTQIRTHRYSDKIDVRK